MSMTTARVPARRVAQIVALLVGAGCASAVGALRRDAPPDRLLVLACAFTVLGAAVRLGHQGQRRSSASWVASSAHAVARFRASRPYDLAVAAWVLVVLAVAGVDLAFLADRSPRDPTLSRLIGDLTAVPAGRAVLFGAWLAWGGWVALGWRRARP
ncbi:MAG: hypothetical protein M0004_06525 [Actinomycetota bacterium]|nr:hypothetical protein [Actinomycetota bacterium]